MLARTEDILQTFPARPLRPDERELMAEWLAAAGDVSSAFVSERRTDDPAIYRRIAISVDGNDAFTHLIHTPLHNDVWVVLDVRYKPEFHQFDSLREALNFVRPVFRWSDNRQGDQHQGQQEYRLRTSQIADGRRLDRPPLDDMRFDVV